MDTVLRVALLLIAALFLLMGLAFMIQPERAQELFAVNPVGALGLSTLRGDLGGLFVAAGVVTCLGLRDPRAVWLPALAVLMGAIAIGRIIGLVVDGFDAQALSNIVVELITVAIAMSAHRRLS